MKFPGAASRQQELGKDFLENPPKLLHSSELVQGRGEAPLSGLCPQTGVFHGPGKIPDSLKSQAGPVQQHRILFSNIPILLYKKKSHSRVSVS